MREDLIVQSKVVAGDDVDTGILLDLPVSKTESLGLGKEVGLGDLATPVWCMLAMKSKVVRRGTDKLQWPSSGHEGHPYGGNRESRTEPFWLLIQMLGLM